MYIIILYTFLKNKGGKHWWICKDYELIILTAFLIWIIILFGTYKSSKINLTLSILIILILIFIDI